MCRLIRLTCWFVGLLPLVGCAKPVAVAPTAKLPEVLVGKPVVREVVDFEVFTGRTEASERVDIRSRLTGYLDRTYFREGDLVKEGDLLFLIDPRTYQAELSRAEANLTQSQTRVKRLDSDYERAKALYTKNAIGREEHDRLLGDRDEARAAVVVAESNLRLARLNIKYTEIRAPCSGRISRRNVDPGNLVKADDTILTVLVALDPMYVYFDVDERTLLRRLMAEGIVTPSASANKPRLPVQIGLADEDGFPHAGAVNFVDNHVDPNTGTMWMRAVFEDTKRVIPPGLFARIRFPIGGPYQAVMVAEQALGTDQERKFLFVVGDDNKVIYRPVVVGQLHNGLRVIKQGLKAEERVVVSGLQRVRAGGEIQPKSVDMLSRVAVQQPPDMVPNDKARAQLAAPPRAAP
jgi:RND family efflux transporter MFP subunit